MCVIYLVFVTQTPAKTTSAKKAAVEEEAAPAPRPSMLPTPVRNAIKGMRMQTPAKAAEEEVVEEVAELTTKLPTPVRTAIQDLQTGTPAAKKQTEKEETVESEDEEKEEEEEEEEGGCKSPATGLFGCAPMYSDRMIASIPLYTIPAPTGARCMM